MTTMTTLYPKFSPALLAAALLLSALHGVAQTTTPAAVISDNSELLVQKTAREARIAQLEQNNSVYSAELGEAYSDLGFTLAAMGEHEAATTMLGKSLQALRSSKGLHDLSQLPVLQTLLKANEALQQWEEVDMLHTLIYYITSKGLEPGNDIRHQAALNLGRWKLHAAESKLLPEREQPAADAIDMYKREISKLQAGAAINGKNLQLSTLYLDLADAELMESKRIFASPLRDYDASGQSATTQQQQCETLRFPDGRVQRICTLVDVPNLNFYIAKTNNKNLQIGTHMGVMREAVKQSLTALRSETADSPQRMELLMQTDKLIHNYNDFMQAVNSTVNTKLGKSATP